MDAFEGQRNAPDYVVLAYARTHFERFGGMEEKQACVYLLASGPRGTLYIGVTSNLVKRVWQHKEGFVEGFTKAYCVHCLVWFEVHASMESAISREKALKFWKRAWKVELVEETNPEWRDLYPDICGGNPAMDSG